MTMMLSSSAGAPLHANPPAKSSPPPKASASVINRTAQGKVRVLVQVNAAAAKGTSVSAMTTANAVAADFAHRSPHNYNHIPFLAMMVDAADLARLQNDPRIAGIEEDHLNEITLTDTTALIGAPLAWTSGYSGAGQSIAILDTGFDTTHPMLQGKVVAEACFSSPQNGSSSLCPNGQSQQVGAGAAINCSPLSGGSMGFGCTHGTHVAGIALGSSAVVSGVAPGANLIAIQVFSKITSGCGGSPPCLSAWDSDILQALDQAYAWRTQYNIAAVSMSLGGGAYTTQAACDAGGSAYKSIFALFNQAGIPVVIAAGNNSATNAVSIPACVTGAVSAGATTKQDGIATYSNNADFLSLLAPGSSVFSSVPGGYATMSGTSMSTPHIAGALAVLKSKMPNASVMQLIETLQNTGMPITDTRAGAGNRVKKRIALFAALNALDPNWKSDAFEPDDTPAQAQPFSLNTPQTYRFGVPGDTDWVKLSVQAGKTYRIETLNLSNNTDTIIALYASGNFSTPVAVNDDVMLGVDLRSVVTYTPNYNGDLYAMVYDWNAGAFLNTRYDLQAADVSVVPSTSTPTPTSTATSTPTSTSTSTSTTTPTVTPTPTSTSTTTPTPTSTSTPTTTPASTPTVTMTPTPTPAQPNQASFSVYLPMLRR